MIWIKNTPSGIVLTLHCQPGAKQTKVLGLHDDCLKISLQAPALENRANACLLAWLSKKLKIPQKQIQILSGQNSRKKRILIPSDTSFEEVKNALYP